MKHTIKLSKRLQQIEKMVTKQYDHIWDCCCDHGFLGFALLSSQPKSNIHFVDIVPELVTNVESKLERFCPTLPWETHCLDVAKLPLAQYQGKHLIIIAGVGGDLMIKFIEAIYQQHCKNMDIDFLLCPVHHQYSLREKLIALNFSLQNEMLITENQRFYELILVSSLHNKSSKISAIGDKIWQPSTIKHADIADKYRQKTLKHYRRIQQGFQHNNQENEANNIQKIIDAYQAVTK